MWWIFCHLVAVVVFVDKNMMLLELMLVLSRMNEHTCHMIAFIEIMPEHARSDRVDVGDGVACQK